MDQHLFRRAAALFAVIQAALLLLLGGFGLLSPAGVLHRILPLLLGMGLLSLAGGFAICQLFRRWREEQRQLLEHLEGRLQLIRQGDCNIYLDCPAQSDSRSLVDTINNLTQAMQLARRQLENERQKTSYILDNMDSGLLLVDGSGIVRQCNSSAYKYLSGAEQIPGMALTAVTDHPAILQAVEDALTQEVSSVQDLDLTDTAGAVVSARVNPMAASWLGDKYGLAAVVILTNVTQARQMEQMRGEFIANISHELKTPITSIRGFAELLQSGMVNDREKVESYIGRILTESIRMSSLIEDILRLSTLENKPPEERTERVDLAALCDDIFDALTPQLAAKDLTHQRRGRAFFQAHPEDMRQLLKNLVENAVKYNRQGGSVTVRLQEDARRCTITVSDTGIGIPIEHQPRIFERFYRVDKGRSKREGGTGLGLSIVKHVAAKYKGQIHLTSKPEEGTSIKILLPVAQESPLPPSAPTP